MAIAALALVLSTTATANPLPAGASTGKGKALTPYTDAAELYRQALEQLKKQKETEGKQ